MSILFNCLTEWVSNVVCHGGQGVLARNLRAHDEADIGQHGEASVLDLLHLHLGHGSGLQQKVGEQIKTMNKKQIAFGRRTSVLSCKDDPSPLTTKSAKPG